jgi:hypothetical protein
MALAPPSPEAKRQLACKTTSTAEPGEGGGRGIPECFRIDASGRVIDTQYNLVSREEADTDEVQRGYYSVEPNPNPFVYQRYNNNGYNAGNGQRGDGNTYDSSGRALSPQRNAWPWQSWQPPWQQQNSGQAQQRVQPQAQAPRDQYGRTYQQTPQQPNGWGWGNRY